MPQTRPQGLQEPLLLHGDDVEALPAAALLAAAVQAHLAQLPQESVHRARPARRRPA